MTVEPVGSFNPLVEQVHLLPLPSYRQTEVFCGSHEEQRRVWIPSSGLDFYPTDSVSIHPPSPTDSCPFGLLHAMPIAPVNAYCLGRSLSGSYILPEVHSFSGRSNLLICGRSTGMSLLGRETGAFRVVVVKGAAFWTKHENC